MKGMSPIEAQKLYVVSLTKLLTEVTANSLFFTIIVGSNIYIYMPDCTQIPSS
jgi:hypothetical protein